MSFENRISKGGKILILIEFSEKMELKHAEFVSFELSLKDQSLLDSFYSNSITLYLSTFKIEESCGNLVISNSKNSSRQSQLVSKKPLKRAQGYAQKGTAKRQVINDSEKQRFSGLFTFPWIDCLFLRFVKI